MADRKPPRLFTDECETFLVCLDYLRESVITKLDGLDEDEVRSSPVDSGTSLMWIIKHLTRAEWNWVIFRFLGETPSVAEDQDTVVATDTVASVVAAYRELARRVEEIVRQAPGLDAPCRNIGDDSPINLRWVLMHLVEEIARHAGHADILRELIDGTTGR